MKKDKEKIQVPTSPTFIARFQDGLVTRMSTHCQDGKLDLSRGVAVAQAAYEKRTGKPPPPIVAAKYIEPGYDDTVLHEYDVEELGGGNVHKIHNPSAPTKGDPR